MSKSNYKVQGTFFRKKKATKSKAKVCPAIAVSRVYHLTIGASRLRQTTAFLKRSGLRHYVTAFFKGGLQMVVCINPLSQVEQGQWRELKSHIV